MTRPLVIKSLSTGSKWRIREETQRSQMYWKRNQTPSRDSDIDVHMRRHDFQKRKVHFQKYFCTQPLKLV